MIYVLQISDAQLLPAIGAVHRHSLRLRNSYKLIVASCQLRSIPYFRSVLRDYCKNQSLVLYLILPKLPLCIAPVLNYLVNLFPIRLPLIHIYQSSYCFWGFYYRKCRKTIFVGDGFGIKATAPMKHGSLLGVVKNRPCVPVIYRPIFYSPTLLSSGMCTTVNLYSYARLSRIKALFDLGRSLFYYSLLFRFLSRLPPFSVTSILIIAPSNFSENNRISLDGEVSLYLDDISLYLRSIESTNVVVVIKPHPYGANFKYNLISRCLRERFPNVTVINESFSSIILEHYLYLLESYIQSLSDSRTFLYILAYQTLWPTLQALKSRSTIRVGFSGSKYRDLFHSNSLIQRIKYQEAIPHSLLLS